VLNDDERVPAITQFYEHLHELRNVIKVQTRRGLIQQIQRPPRAALSQLRGQLHPLRLTT
jgi:hypothetical protein